jgi:sec-independent protein translocase protein TatA
MFENLGFTELLMILVLVLVLFGAKRVPEIGASIGRGIRDFKRALNGTDEPLADGTSRAIAPLGRAAPADEPLVRPEPKRLL